MGKRTKKRETTNVKKTGTKKKRKSRGVSLKDLSYKKLNTQIRGYGSEYSLKKHLLRVVLVLAAMVGISVFFHLSPVRMVLLALAALTAMPIITLAQFRYLNSNSRFEQLVNYMDQMILSFKRIPKILIALESTIDLIDGELKACVEKAIDIIKNDSTSPDIYERAFKVIEDEFPNSRMKTLHRFILNVERENSKKYQESLDNLYFDTRSWITRTYQYQADLNATKSKILIILGLSLAITACFSKVLAEAEATMGGTYDFNILGNPLYQTATLVYLVAFIVIYTLLNSKINGHWMVNDISNQKDAMILRYIEEQEKYKGGFDKKAIIVGLIFGALFAVAGLIFDKTSIIVLGGIVAAFMAYKKKLKYNTRKKAIERELTKEFPIWMRDIAINLHNMVVVRAVEVSVENASAVLKPFLTKFLKKTEKNPTSIRPYLDFLGEYKVSELATAIKTLYSIRMLSVEESQRQINDLIQRNQSLLENSEKIRNQDSVAAVSFISMLPMILLSFKLMIDLAIMMSQFLGLMNGSF